MVSASWDDEYLTVNEVAERLKLNHQTIRNWIDQGQLPSVRLGVRRVRIRRSDLEQILTEGSQSTADDKPARPPRLTEAQTDELAQAIEDAQQLLAHLAAGAEKLADVLSRTQRALAEQAEPPESGEKLAGEAAGSTAQE